MALIFAAIICWLRLDFSITRDAKWLAAQRKERASAALQRILLLIAGAPVKLPLFGAHTQWRSVLHHPQNSVIFMVMHISPFRFISQIPRDPRPANPHACPAAERRKALGLLEKAAEGSPEDAAAAKAAVDEKLKASTEKVLPAVCSHRERKTIAEYPNLRTKPLHI